MNSSTTTPFGPEFVKELIHWFFQAIGDATARAYRMIWDILIAFIMQNLMLFILTLVLVLVFAFADYKITGRWANLGSVLYSYIYYGILFLISLTFGPEIFAKDWVDLLLFVVYVASFIWVRIILNRTGIRRGH